MQEDIYFSALGGGQRVGDSCYFLKLGQAGVLLDCGMGRRDNPASAPDLYPLLQPPLLESLNQVGQVFVSHAHLDHIGFLPGLLANCPQAQAYMTETTLALAEHQLGQRALQALAGRITAVSYCQTLDFGGYQAMLLPAGHIPGAAMVSLTYQGRQILYTGDFSLADTLLTGGCWLPDDLHPEVLILCAVHGGRPGQSSDGKELQRRLAAVLAQVNRRGAVYCQVRQLSKGVELVKGLTQLAEETPYGPKIYLEEPVMAVVRRLESLGTRVLSANNYLYRHSPDEEPHVLVGVSRTPAGYWPVRTDFSLHVDFQALVSLIKRLSPKAVLVVHCQTRGADRLLALAVNDDGASRTEIVQAEDGVVFQL